MNRHVRDLPSGMVAEEGCTSPFNDPARTRSTSSHIMSSLKQLRSTMNKKTKSISNQIRKKVKSIKMPQCILTCVRVQLVTESVTLYLPQNFAKIEPNFFSMRINCSPTLVYTAVAYFSIPAE